MTNGPVRIPPQLERPLGEAEYSAEEPHRFADLAARDQTVAPSAELLMQAYALTGREREVCQGVMAGWSMREIGARLFISANTVQDHLKSVFAKVDVRSRGELVARLRPDGLTP